MCERSYEGMEGLFEEYVFAVGADGYGFDGDAGGDFEGIEVVEEVLGQ